MVFMDSHYLKKTAREGRFSLPAPAGYDTAL